MKIIRTHEAQPEDTPVHEREWIYNGLDCCVTHDCFEAMHPQLNPHTSATYDFSRALQGPVLEMRLRGCLVDNARKIEVIDELWTHAERLEEHLNRIVYEGVGVPNFNWRSPGHLADLFYNHLSLPPIRKHGRPTVDRSARERLEVYPSATVLINLINALAEIGKRISFLRTEIDPDGRIRTSYNIAGTSTGRFSSTLSEFGTGSNLQNIEEYLRSILIADPGCKFAKFDAKSGESFCVGAIEWNLFRDPRYLESCESGDPHTASARLCWPNLPWTGVLKHDKQIAEQLFYRHYTYRFMCKKLGHGSNYDGKAPTLAEQARIPVDLVENFQSKYFTAYPAHRRWQAHVDHQLRSKGYLISLTGRQRYFFGRRNDPKTLREAIAYDPQCSLADIVNAAMIKVWRTGIATLMFQDHDALTFMYPEKDEERIIPILQRELVVPIQLADGRELRIPYDCEVGWNKGKYCCGERKPECAEKGCKGTNPNPDGLRGYSGRETRKRQPKAGILDRLVHRTDGQSRCPAHLPQVDSDILDSGSA